LANALLRNSVELPNVHPCNVDVLYEASGGSICTAIICLKS